MIIEEEKKVEVINDENENQENEQLFEQISPKKHTKTWLIIVGIVLITFLFLKEIFSSNLKSIV